VTRGVEYALLNFHRDADSVAVPAAADLAAAQAPGQQTTAAARLNNALQMLGRYRGFDAGYLASSCRRAGELHEAKGDTRKALRRYRQFVELWRNADPELQPEVEAVRARIRALEEKVG
jgi:putative intracellular protease/amidase